MAAHCRVRDKLFLHLKRFLDGQSLESDQETKDAVQEWLNGLAVNFFDKGIQKLMSRYDKSSMNIATGLNKYSDYIEK